MIGTVVEHTTEEGAFGKLVLPLTVCGGSVLYDRCVTMQHVRVLYVCVSSASQGQLSRLIITQHPYVMHS